VLDTINQLCQPRKPIPPETTRLNGITDAATWPVSGSMTREPRVGAADGAKSERLSQKRAGRDVTDPPRYAAASHRDAQILNQHVEPNSMTST
jgi:hypothetical protein